MAKKILLADDSITIQKVISITFASEDYELIVVGDGDSAAKKIKEIKPDLVMADVAMPGKTGYEVCEVVKKDPSLRKIPVMLLAGTFEPLNRDEATRVSADDSIVKPFESQELLDKVRGLLARSEAQERLMAQTAGAASAKVQEAKAPEKALEISEDIWETGDFIGFTEEEKKPDFKDESPDLDFLEGGLFEEHKDLSLPHENEFLDLDIKDEEVSQKTEAKKEEPFEVERFGDFKTDVFGKEFDLNEPFEAEPIEEFKPEEAYKTEEFKSSEPSKEASQKAPAPFEMEPFDVEPFKAGSFGSAFEKEEPASDEIWAEEKPQKPISKDRFEGIETLKPEAFAPEKEQIAESDLLEAAPEIIEEAPPKLTFAEPLRGAPVPEPSKFEAPSPVKEAVAAPPAVPVEQVIEKAAAEVEKRLEGLTATLESRIAIPREKIEEAVSKIAREIIEEIAWEVIPELAEDIIKAEMNKIKEAFARVK